MKNIEYYGIDWEGKAKRLKERDAMLTYDPRERDLEMAIFCESANAVLALELGRLDILAKRVENTKKYLEKEKKKKKITDTLCEEKIIDYFEYYSTKYYNDWYNGEIDVHAEQIVKECIEKKFFEIYEEKKMCLEERSERQKNAILICCKFGYFEIAREKIFDYGKINTYELDKNLIYDFYGFYLMYTEYMLGIGNVSTEAVETYFLTMFAEYQKGNYTLLSTYCGVDGMYKLYYLYYRYFLGLPEDEVTAEHVYGSCKNGVLYWREA